MLDSFNIYFGRNVKQFKTIAPVRIKKLFEILLWYCRNRKLEVSAEHFQKRIVFLKNI